MDSEDQTSGEDGTEDLEEKVGRTLRWLKWVGVIIGGPLIYFYPLTIGFIVITEGVHFGDPPDWLHGLLYAFLTPAEWLYKTWPVYENSLDVFLDWFDL